MNFVQIKRLVNLGYYLNPIFRTHIYNRYYKPDEVKPYIKISKNSHRYLEELKEKGVVKISGKFADLAQYINDKYFSIIENKSRSGFEKYILSENNPSILYIPAGYANGFMSLNAEATLIWYSTATIEEAKEDDIRYDAYYWNAWEIEQR